MSSIILIKLPGDRNIARVQVEGEEDLLALAYRAWTLLSWMQQGYVYEASTEKVNGIRRTYQRTGPYEPELDKTDEPWSVWESGFSAIVCDQGLIERFGFLPDRIYIRQISTIEDYEKSKASKAG